MASELKRAEENVVARVVIEWRKCDHQYKAYVQESNRLNETQNPD